MTAITIITPFAGKSFCFQNYQNTIAAVLQTPNITFSLLALNNSNNPAFTSTLTAWLQTLTIPYTLLTDTVPAMDTNAPFGQALKQRVYDIYQVLFAAIPANQDYVLVVEDDIECTDTTAVTTMINLFSQLPNLFSISGATYGRRLDTIAFSRPQAWIQPVSEGIKWATPKISNMEIVTYTAMGFYMARAAWIETYFPKGVVGVDVWLGQNATNDGKLVGYHWGIACKHYYKNADGSVVYADVSTLVPYKQPPTKEEMIQIDRPGSPLFVSPVALADLSHPIQKYITAAARATATKQAQAKQILQAAKAAKLISQQGVI